MADKLATFISRPPRNPRSINLLEPQGLSRPVTRIVFLNVHIVVFLRGY
jgi:hypothetical protein